MFSIRFRGVTDSTNDFGLFQSRENSKFLKIFTGNVFVYFSYTISLIFDLKFLCLKQKLSHQNKVFVVQQYY